MIRSAMSEIPKENWDRINWKESLVENDKKMDKIIKDVKVITFEESKDYGQEC